MTLHNNTDSVHCQLPILELTNDKLCAIMYLIMKEIPLTRGYIALVDDQDYERVVAAGPWHAMINKQHVCAKHQTYDAETGRVSCIYMHRFVLGVTEPDVFVDHIDHNALNNQRGNLRRATKGENARNARKYIRPTSSKFKGVYWNKGRQGWKSQIVKQGVKTYLGFFTDEKEAAMAYDKAARETFGEFACVNFPLPEVKQ